MFEYKLSEVISAVCIAQMILLVMMRLFEILGDEVCSSLVLLGVMLALALRSVHNTRYY